ncbi:putative membrane protein YqhA [Bosea sp. 124]|nr:putative membrane protein YqhA [Bosea sp. 124]
MRAVQLLFRWIIACAAIGMVLCALVLLVEAGINITSAVRSLIAHDGSKWISSIMKSVDECLFGVILVLLAAKILASFVVPDEVAQSFPKWMKPSDVAELKSTFCQAVIVYLIVDFATDMAILDSKTDFGLLVLPAGIVLIAGALKLMPHSAHS